MENNDMTEVIIVLTSMIAGGLEYLLINFWMLPILRYIEIRHKKTADLIFYANVQDPDNLNDECKESHRIGAESFRRYAAEIAACYCRLPFWYRIYLKEKSCEEDPIKASKCLIGLSNCYDSKHAGPHIAGIVKSLCIPASLDI